MTTALAAPGGTTVFAEVVSGNVFPVAKVHLGASDTDGGPITVTNALPTMAATVSTAAFGSLATAGAAIKASAGSAFAWQWINNTAGSVFAMFFDATTTRSNGTVPDSVSTSSIASGGASGSNVLGNVPWGMPCASGIWAQASSSLATMTSIATTTITGKHTWQ